MQGNFWGACFWRETGKAPPTFASLGHLPTYVRRLFAAKGRQKGSSLCGELAELARPEGLCSIRGVLGRDKSLPYM